MCLPATSLYAVVPQFMDEKVDADFKDIELANRLVILAFPVKEDAKLWFAQLDIMKSLVKTAKAQEKWMKCGKSTEVRVKHDLKAGILISFLKLADTVHQKMEQTKVAMSANMPDHQRPPIDLSQHGYMFDANMLQCLAEVAEVLLASGKDAIQQLSEITAKRHTGDDLWKANLAADAPVKDVLALVADTFGKLNQENLESALAKLMEVAFSFEGQELFFT